MQKIRLFWRTVVLKPQKCPIAGRCVRSCCLGGAVRDPPHAPHLFSTEVPPSPGGNMEFCREQTQKECVHLYYSQTSTKIICLMSQLLRAVSLFIEKASIFEYLPATLVWNYTACPWILFSSLRERRLFPNYCASRGGGDGLERGSTVQIILKKISDTPEKNTRSTWSYARSVYEFGCHAHVHWN